jgi:inosose dehydratase
MNTPVENSFTRRDFLKTGAAGAGAVLLGGLPAAAEEKKDPYAGFKMGVQSYSLRGFDTKTALDHTRTLGLSYWEAYPGHIRLSTIPAHVQEHRALLKDKGVELLAYGVIGFDANETKAREAFDFARAMGIVSISADPQKDKATFDLLDRLVEEYDIAIAIHNHGPRHRYDKIDDVLEMVKDRHPKIGACVDTGHYIRSDEDPVEALERFGKRVHGVHLKDVRTVVEGDRRRKIFTILGEGDLDVLGCLKVLRRLDYDKCLSLEYEENPDNPLSDIEACLKSVREAAGKLG